MYCKACGNRIKDHVLVCLECGTPKQPNIIEDTKFMQYKNKTVFVLLAIFLGGLGIHRFYLGGLSNVVLGVIMLLFVWTGIPPIIAVVEAVVIGLRKNDPRFL